ncbi:hypothetical protein [Mesorhizobium sp. M1E.F.Ca.ET.041.01.1.1]|uniref:hypothetical protein n=1 Tax=Mesorhizobium sp. M1E.F.Ca.ET.041.01.1.1 TaxID=2496759 RepID=UPI000FCAA913|nr:hypothetical protein [Mesorhizobium sp. M1E.F.Ca.ET.041.01.1.1]RUW26806.1 hypothetical protein EOA38_26745 [Mesorhizobium sp. M1E.F.Ca.ET.041.01.1.1]
MDTAVANDFVADLVQTTKAAWKNISTYKRPPEALNLAGHSNQTELWGTDSALDFFETRWGEVAAHLLISAESKRQHANIVMPTMGIRAEKQLNECIKQALPGCTVTISCSVMRVDWTDLI